MADCDVCIIGSGAGGGIAAWSLAQAGLKVIVLERGRFYTPRDLLHDEIRNKRFDFFVPYAADDPQLLKQDGDQRFRITRSLWTACCVGGGTTHMGGSFYRLWPEDFRMASLFGNPPGASVADWPITYDDLEPYYTRIEYLIGLSGIAGQYPFEPRRSKPFPLPPLKVHPAAALIDKAAKGLGLHPFPTPRAALSLPYRGRSACIYHADCGTYGCPIGAKSGTLYSVLPEAIRTGRCRVIPEAMTYKLETGADGTVQKAVYFDAKGESQTVTARCFVAACAAVQTARLLLNSKSGRFPRGLANGSGQVGRNLSFSTASNITARYRKGKRGELDLGSNALLLQRSLQDYYIVKNHKAHGLLYPKGGTCSFVMSQRAPVLRAERILERLGAAAPRRGRELRERIVQEMRDYVNVKMETFLEFLPNPKTFVDVDRKYKDQRGVPAVRATVKRHPAELPMAKFIVERGRRILQKTGPASIYAEPQAGTTFILQQGTCRFGTDPSSSVLNPDCRAHEIANLYVADGSFMPTSGGVPSTFTIMANSLRVSEKIAAAFKAGRL
ncbi:MAG: GMC family oxidoreductase [Elusimicrobiota bacterium]